MDEGEALELDADDPLPSRRDLFEVPPWQGGAYPDWAYFAGNSLGLMPRQARAAIAAELDVWSDVAVEGWFEAPEPWLEYAGTTRPSIAGLVGARDDEVAATGALTVNLHLLLASFYRPTADRFRILVEDSAFPSDSHAVQSQAAWHGLDPTAVVVRVTPRPGESTLRTNDVVDRIAQEGEALALVLLGAVNYLTGELPDLRAITAAAHGVGAVSGWDLAHAIGNVPVELHDAGVDFAAWCHYKYVNGGPGAPGGVFVHARHTEGEPLPRLAGWWAVDPAERFLMRPDFVPRAGAEGWAISTPPILAFAPLRAALRIFDEVGIDALRARSVRLTAYLERLLDEVAATCPITVMTPRDPERRGCQLSVAVAGASSLAARLRYEHGVVCDFREPDVLRFAPVPLYNTFHDCWRGAVALQEVLSSP